MVQEACTLMKAYIQLKIFLDNTCETHGWIDEE